MQKQETDICTKFAPPYSILFMGELDEEIIRVSEFEPYLWWRYIDEIFILWWYNEDKLILFNDKTKKVHSSVNFTSE